MNERQAKGLALWMIATGLGLGVVALATGEFANRGTQGVTGIAVADYRARAQVESGPAPDFRVPSLKPGPEISLSDHLGEVVVLNFWASWCTPCRTEAPGLQRTWDRYRADGVQFLGIDSRDDPAAAKAFVHEFGLTYPSGVDPSGSLGDDYALVGMPTTFVIGSDGRLAYRFVGYVDERTLASALDEVLLEETA